MSRKHVRKNIQAMRLEGKAQMYWAICKARHGRGGPADSISTESALQILSAIEDFSSTTPQFQEIVTGLINDIVGNGRTYNGICELIILEFVVRSNSGEVYLQPESAA